MSGIQVLIVDDNQAYREAFRRNLELSGYRVLEAEDSLEALQVLQSDRPEVVVTDLAMRHPTEGLDLIRQVRSLRPHLPVIMISAVGTFDEGAEATRLGASQVISKSRIDEEMDSLYRAIDEASAQYASLRQDLLELNRLAASARDDPSGAIAALNALLRREDAAPAIKGDAFDLITSLELDNGGRNAPPVSPREALKSATKEILREVEEALKAETPAFETLQDETRKNLITAEFLYRQSSEAMTGVDFSRSIGFTYCFAVENEAKFRLRKRIQKFFGDHATGKLIKDLCEKDGKRLSIFYQQYLLRTQAGSANEATIENFHHTFMRIIEHRGRYKPDGLKALGIILICFGRTYNFRSFDREVKIDNPLGLKGFENSEHVLKFASLLINLQHYRNPFIHPEISELTKLSKIRTTTLDCLRHVVSIQ